MGKAYQKRKRDKVNGAKDKEVNGQGRKKAGTGVPWPHAGCGMLENGTENQHRASLQYSTCRASLTTHSS